MQAANLSGKKRCCKLQKILRKQGYSKMFIISLDSHRAGIFQFKYINFLIF